MAGILDNKSRVLDNIITPEGRRQLSAGKLAIEYVTFTDSATFYKANASGSIDDASSRLYLQASSLPHDKITFQADDSGMLKPGGPFSADNDYVFNNGEIYNYSGSQWLPESIPNVFNSKIEGILTSSINNFKNLQIIGTIDRIYDDETFVVSPKNITYTVTDKLPISNPKLTTANIDYRESLFNDPRLANLVNFKYLPPVVRIADRNIDKRDSSQTTAYRLGDYPPLGPSDASRDKLYNDLIQSLKTYENNGYMRTINVEQTSKGNSLLCQFFENTGLRLKKLDVIDFGEFTVTLGNKRVRQKIYFAGKIVVDNNDTHSFIHLFTMVFE